MDVEVESKNNNKDRRFDAIYGPENNSSSSDSEDEQSKFGNKKLSIKKKEKLISYLFYQINITR